MSQYYTLITQAGSAAEANAKGLGQVVNLSEFAVGDSNGVEYDPTGEETTLKNELYRGLISDITVDPDEPNQFTVECVIPQEVGGFTIREAAIFTEDGVLYGLAKYPPSFKTTLESGTSSELRVKFVFTTTSSNLINLTIDPSLVLTSREYVDDSFNSVSIDGNSNAQRNREHIFLAHADLQLLAETNNSTVDVIVDNDVDLETGDCRVKAPTGEKISVAGELHDIARIKLNNQMTRFRRINGVWKV